MVIIVLVFYMFVLLLQPTILCFEVVDEGAEVVLGLVGVADVLLHVVGQLLVLGHGHKLLRVVHGN